jgi:hypothetical protein
MVEAVLAYSTHEALGVRVARGERTGVRMVSTPIAANTSSKLVVNLVSRSRIVGRTPQTGPATPVLAIVACAHSQAPWGHSSARNDPRHYGSLIQGPMTKSVAADGFARTALLGAFCVPNSSQRLGGRTAAARSVTRGATKTEKCTRRRPIGRARQHPR